MPHLCSLERAKCVVEYTSRLLCNAKGTESQAWSIHDPAPCGAWHPLRSLLLRGFFFIRWPAMTKYFSILHMAFEEITTSGSRASEDFRVHVVTDERGWAGSSDLIVSFSAPTWTLLLEPQIATIAFGVQNTPQGIRTLMKTLGIKMTVHATTLGNEANVYITKHRPNKSGYATVCDFSNTRAETQECLKSTTRTTIKAKVQRKSASIVVLAGRVSFLSKELQADLKDQNPVGSIQISPCIISVIIDKVRNTESTFPFRC